MLADSGVRGLNKEFSNAFVRGMRTFDGLRPVLFNPSTPESASMGHPSRDSGIVVVAEVRHSPHKQPESFTLKLVFGVVLRLGA